MHSTRDPVPPSVIHLLAPASFGGLESAVSALARGQAARGDQVSVALLLPPAQSESAFLADLELSRVPVHRLEVPERRYLAERRVVKELLLTAGPSVLHTHGYRPDVVDAPVARAMGIHTVSTVHGFTGGGLKNRVYEWVQRQAFRRFDAVVAVSVSLGEELRSAGVSEERLHVVPNAWEPSFTFLERRQAREVLGIPEGPSVIGWIGRMTREKGPDVMVRALGALGPSFELSMIGSGPMQGELDTLSAALGLTSRVRCHGVLPEAARFLRAFDVLCISSWTEGTPMVLLEAMAAEVPVVTTSVGGIPDVISPQEAVLVPAGNAAAIAGAIQGLLSDPVLARSKARAAADRLSSAYNIEGWVQQYRDLYASCSTGKNE